MKAIFTFVFISLFCSVSLLAQIVAGGRDHSLALCADGTIRACGSNGKMCLGNPSVSSFTNNPVQVQGITDVRMVAAGDFHSLAVKTDGTAWAWGRGDSGELGDSTFNWHNTPVQINALSNVTSIKGGYFFSLALKSDSTVWAWGRNNSGELGNGSYNNSNFPVQCVGLSGIVSIAAGEGFAAAVKSNGTVWVWGDSNGGELGNGTTIPSNSNIPLQVNNLSNIIQVSCGRHHILALKADGTVWAWGLNDYRQLGDSTTVYTSNVPVQVHGLANVVAVYGSEFNSTVLRSDSTVWCWGNATYGQNGDNSYTLRPLPVKVQGLDSAIDAGVGAVHCLAVRANGKVFTWGNNSIGALGDGSTNASISHIVQMGTGCSAITGINEMATQKNAFTVYPNPAGNFFVITTPEINSDNKLVITDIAGRELKRMSLYSPETVIASDGFCTGVYLINLETANGTATQKLFIHR